MLPPGENNTKPTKNLQEVVAPLVDCLPTSPEAPGLIPSICINLAWWCTPRIPAAEAKRSAVQGHPLQSREFATSLGHRRHYLNKTIICEGKIKLGGGGGDGVSGS